jgi:hypothetical protein
VAKKRRAKLQDESEGFECGALRFTRERVEKIRDGKRVTSFARERADRVRVELESRSEHPLQETLWSIGLGAGAYFVLRSALNSGSMMSWIGGIALGAGCVALLANLARRSPVLIVQQEESTARIALECKLSAQDVEDVNRRLADELGWPVNG